MLPNALSLLKHVTSDIKHVDARPRPGSGATPERTRSATPFASSLANHAPSTRPLPAMPGRRKRTRGPRTPQLPRRPLQAASPTRKQMLSQNRQPPNKQKRTRRKPTTHKMFHPNTPPKRLPCEIWSAKNKTLKNI